MIEVDHAATAPVIKSIEVPLTPDEAFQLFTRGMGEWWPLHTHSIAADTHEGRVQATELVFEEGVGGKLLEKMSDGSAEPWGEVLVWDPPHRAVFTWKPNLEDAPFTEVEVTFRHTTDGTLVRLEHRGWERFADDAARRREAYDSGWPGVLELFRSAAG